MVGNCRKSRHHPNKHPRIRSAGRTNALLMAKPNICLLQLRLRSGTTIPAVELRPDERCENRSVDVFAARQGNAGSNEGPCRAAFIFGTSDLNRGSVGPFRSRATFVDNATSRLYRKLGQAEAGIPVFPGMTAVPTLREPIQTERLSQSALFGRAFRFRSQGMMNASFRTAFWAMCLGLTVPMMLFVGVELTSGGRTSGNRKIAAAIASGSLQSRWNAGSASAAGHSHAGTPGRPTEPKARSHSKSVVGREPPRRGPAVEGARLIPLLEPDVSGPTPREPWPEVVLGPQLESDPATPDEQASIGPRFSAIPTATRPRAEIDPNELKPTKQPVTTRIEAQLDEILGQLDRLASGTVNRTAAPDPMQQASELLLRLQQARQIQEQAARLPVIEVPETKPQEETPAKVTPEEPVILEPAPTQLEDAAEKPVETPAPAPASTTPAKSAPATPTPQTKIFRPRYIAVRALETLATPLLTAGVGRIGAASSETESMAGDLQLPTQWDALVVRDTPDVLRKIDRLIRELDVPPERILVEASVITIRLNPTMPYGIDLGEFNTTGQPFSIYPADLASAGAWGAHNRPTTSAGGIPTLTHGTGIKCGILRGDVRAFLQVLQASNQIRGTAASQTTIVNKQTTEILLSDGFAAASDGARPLSGGTILRVRPLVTRDGLIHLDVRPIFGAEATSWTGGTTIREGSLGNQMTLQAGETAVVSGFIADHIVAHSYNKSAAGELPLVGHWFRGQAGVLQRTETIVLLTPHRAESDLPPLDTVSSAESVKLRPIANRQTEKPKGTRQRAPKPLRNDADRNVDQRTTRQPPSQSPSADANEGAAKTASQRSRQTVIVPTEVDDLSSRVSQTGAIESHGESSTKEKPLAPKRRARSRQIPQTARNSDGLEEIPEIPVPVDEPRGPLIRPAVVR